MRVITAAAALTVAAVAVATAAVATAAPTACGPQQVGSATVRTWCGPAKATVTWAGKTLVIKGGTCEVTKLEGLTMFTVNVGRTTVPPAKPKARAFSAGGLDLAPGSYPGWLVSFQIPGKDLVLRSSKTTVTITKNARKGTFSGTLYGGGTAKGSWTC
jgi:hypothetical protein